MKSLTLAIAFLALIGITICSLDSKVSISEECDCSVNTISADFTIYWLAVEHYSSLADEYLGRQYKDLESVKYNCQSDFSLECINDLEEYYYAVQKFDYYFKNGDFDEADKVSKEFAEITEKINNDCIIISSDLITQKSFVFGFKDLSVDSIQKAIAAKQQ